MQVFRIVTIYTFEKNQIHALYIGSINNNRNDHYNTVPVYSEAYLWMKILKTFLSECSGKSLNV